ncbi:MAG: N-acetyltransferase family protein [Anaerolineae bacterium]
MKERDLFCRRATFADATAIAQVHVDAWQTAYRELLPADFLASLSVSQRLRMWERLLVSESGSSATFVAGEGEKIQGFASVGPAREIDPDWNWGEVYAIYVDHCVWGSGVGYKLMEASHKFLQDVDYQSGMLWVLDGNKRAMQFYERYGFVKDESPQGVKLDQLADVPVREIRYHLEF